MHDKNGSQLVHREKIGVEKLRFFNSCKTNLHEHYSGYTNDNLASDLVCLVDEN